MLKKDQIQQIETLYKIPGLVAAFEAAEETDVELPTGVTVLGEEDLKRVKDAEYKKGKETGIEMDIKAFKAENGLEFEGKNLKALHDAVAKKAVEDAKIAPDKKVEEAKRDLETMRKEYDALKLSVESEQGKANAAVVDRELYRNVPSLGENAPEVGLVWDMMKLKGYEAKLENGVLVAYKNGEPVKDNLANAVAIKDVVTTFAKESRLIPEPIAAPIGRSGNDGKNPIYTKLSELKEDFIKAGKNTNGSEFMEKAMALQKENENFDMNS